MVDGIRLQLGWSTMLCRDSCLLVIQVSFRCKQWLASLKWLDDLEMTEYIPEEEVERMWYGLNAFFCTGRHKEAVKETSASLSDCLCWKWEAVVWRSPDKEEALYLVQSHCVPRRVIVVEGIMQSLRRQEDQEDARRYWTPY
jgi:hypothetical protein